MHIKGENNNNDKNNNVNNPNIKTPAYAILCCSKFEKLSPLIARLVKIFEAVHMI